MCFTLLRIGFVDDLKKIKCIYWPYVLFSSENETESFPPNENDLNLIKKHNETEIRIFFFQISNSKHFYIAQGLTFFQTRKRIVICTIDKIIQIKKY